MTDLENPHIETERLILSPYRREDAAALMRNAGPPEVARMMASIPLPFTEADALRRIERRLCDARRFTLAIRNKATGEAIGEFGAGHGAGAETPDMLYFLRPDHWGEGLVSEAVEAALRHAFMTLGWPALEAEAFDENAASHRVLTKLGFERIGVSGCVSVARDDDAPATLYRLNRIQWATPTLKTERLTLRAPVATDAEPLHALISDYEVSKMLTAVPHPYPDGVIDDFLTGRMSDPGTMTFVIDDGGPCGVIGLDVDSGAELMLGYWLGRPFWRRGYMREATRAVVGHAFARGVTDMESGAFTENARSQTILRGLGFHEISRSMKNCTARGEKIPHIEMMLTRADWEKTR